MLKVLRLSRSRGYLLPVASGASSHHLFIAALRPSALHRKYRTVYQILKTYRIVELLFFSHMSSRPPVIERTQPGVCFVLIACYKLPLFFFFFFFLPTALNQSRVCWRKKGNFSKHLLSDESSQSDLFPQPGCLKFTLHLNGLVFNLVWRCRSPNARLRRLWMTNNSLLSSAVHPTSSPDISAGLSCKS